MANSFAYDATQEDTDNTTTSVTAFFSKSVKYPKLSNIPGQILHRETIGNYFYSGYLPRIWVDNDIVNGIVVGQIAYFAGRIPGYPVGGTQNLED